MSFWDKPRRKSVGLFWDYRLFYELLEAAPSNDIFTKKDAGKDAGEDEDSWLSNRVKGLVLVEKLSNRVIDDLFRELVAFGLIEFVEKRFYQISEKGNEFRDTTTDSKKRTLIIEMHKLYTIPGWFVNRLWELNKDGQGEIVIPTPLKEWMPVHRKWEEKKWTDDLEETVKKSYDKINNILPNSFPVPLKEWIKEVRVFWDRLCNATTRKTVAKARKGEKEKGKQRTYSVRDRLSLAMKEAAIKLLFGNKNILTNENDFEADITLLSDRVFRVWVPRLAELGLIYSTYFHPNIHGRLIFPTSVFGKNKNTDNYSKLEEIKNIHNDFLYLYNPTWKSIKKDFLDTLYREHQKIYSSVRVNSFYVPIQDVRDEVCRQLRISFNTFDRFMELAMEEALNKKSDYTISLETDIREDQSGGNKISRRPVFVKKNIISIIAMTKR